MKKGNSVECESFYKWAFLSHKLFFNKIAYCKPFLNEHVCSPLFLDFNHKHVARAILKEWNMLVTLFLKHACGTFLVIYKAWQVPGDICLPCVPVDFMAQSESFAGGRWVVALGLVYKSSIRCSYINIDWYKAVVNFSYITVGWFPLHFLRRSW